MICEICKVNHATVHITTIKDGKKIDMNLCDECARKTESFYMDNISFQDFFEGLLDMTTKSQKIGAINDLTCPMCHMTYNEFRKSGKFGCFTCYKTFSANLAPIFKRIHGSANHAGKIPIRSGAKLKITQKITHLKNELKDAIEKEEFEVAATLRDEIRILEKGDKNE